ncbi:hypothetical protein LDENG_00093740 [Lucifuga dentata]|nr:hypothetical protein LDENG_00093740 [Lucifuga dentata]
MIHENRKIKVSVRLSLSEWSRMDDVPLKIPQRISEVKGDEEEIVVPDYLTFLQETQYEFRLEIWVLIGLQSGFSSQHRPSLCSSASDVLPSCPPHWMMFSSPQQSRLASRHDSDFWEPNPQQRSHSLNPAVLRTTCTISDSENEESPEKAKASSPENTCVGGDRPAAVCQRVHRKTQTPNANPNTTSNAIPKVISKATPNAISKVTPNAVPNTTGRSDNITFQKTAMSVTADSCSNPPMASRPLAFPSAGSDSSA